MIALAGYILQQNKHLFLLQKPHENAELKPFSNIEHSWCRVSIINIIH